MYGKAKNNCPDIMDGSHTINEVPVLMIINDERYGGIAHSTNTGKTYCMVPTTAGNLGWGYPTSEAKYALQYYTSPTMDDIHVVTDDERNELGQNTGTWRNTLVHEFGGHSFGRLGDEYWYNSFKSPTSSIGPQSWTVPFSLNISPSYEATPWDILLDLQADLVAQDSNYGRIGIFQGGDVSMFNRWRSEKISCMIDNRFYFSAWQRYLIVDRIHTLAGDRLGTEEARIADFLAHDVTTDPIRDTNTSGVIGVSNAIPPRTMPMLPPPVITIE